MLEIHLLPTKPSQDGLRLTLNLNVYMNTFDTLSEAIDDLKKRGYKNDFNLHPDWIACSDLQVTLKPEEFHVDEIHRFEGMTNPDDSAVLYAISSNKNIKGLLVDAYGAYSDSLSPVMIKKLRIDDQTSP